MAKLPIDDTTLQSLIAEIEQLAKEVVEDYTDNPSEISGSITQVHEASPFLATREERLIKNNNKGVDDSLS